MAFKEIILFSALAAMISMSVKAEPRQTPQEEAAQVKAALMDMSMAVPPMNVATQAYNDALNMAYNGVNGVNLFPNVLKAYEDMKMAQNNFYRKLSKYQKETGEMEAKLNSIYNYMMDNGMMNPMASYDSMSPPYNPPMAYPPYTM